MGSPTYAIAGLVLSPGPAFSQPVHDLQSDLRSLGYGNGPIDGIFGQHTTAAVNALQFDLINNAGASSGNDGPAPVAIQDYNDGSVDSLTGVVDQSLVAIIQAMLADPLYPRLPSSPNAAAANQAAIAAVKALAPPPVPLPFLLDILMQESACRHFQVPTATSTDSFVTVGLDTNDPANPAAVTSRGYGIGQYTLFHHPPTADEVANVITDPVQNVEKTITLFLEKFNNDVNGDTPDTQADDRIAEFGPGPLRICQYPSNDPRYLVDCANCLGNAQLFNIVAGQTPVFATAPTDYNKTQYHQGSYQNVPIRANIPCDWPYAARRYNGSGVNSYDYQAELLLRVLNAI